MRPVNHGPVYVRPALDSTEVWQGAISTAINATGRGTAQTSGRRNPMTEAIITNKRHFAGRMD